jgi:polyhydroxyalkanoate synthesis regulator phasin
MREFTDIMKKVGLFGIGLWALTEEKIQEITDELVEDGELKKEEGKKFVREIIEEQKKSRRKNLKTRSQVKFRTLSRKLTLQPKKNFMNSKRSSSN